MFSMNERLLFDELYDAVTAAIKKNDDLKGYIQHTLIPRMDGRRRKPQSLTRKEIVEKIFSDDVSKPGEAVEIVDAMVRSKGKMTPELALEVADVIYYALQPNCPSFVSDPEPLVLGLGIDMKTAFTFCVLKYETRLLYGDSPDYKKIEKEIMTRFFSKSTGNILG